MRNDMAYIASHHSCEINVLQRAWIHIIQRGPEILVEISLDGLQAIALLKDIHTNQLTPSLLSSKCRSDKEQGNKGPLRKLSVHAAKEDRFAHVEGHYHQRIKLNESVRTPTVFLVGDVYAVSLR